MRLKQAQTQQLKLFTSVNGAKVNMVTSSSWVPSGIIQATLQPYTDERQEASYGMFEKRVKRLICDPSVTLFKGTGVGLCDAAAPEYEVDSCDPWSTHHSYLLKLVKP